MRKKVFVKGLFSSLENIDAFLYTGIICSHCLNKCKISVTYKIVSNFVPHAGPNIDVLGQISGQQFSPVLIGSQKSEHPRPFTVLERG